MPPGARERVLFSVPLLVGRQVAFEAVMIAAGDEDPTNDRVYWSISFGVEPRSVLINEVMPIPAGGSEWIEILNRLDRPVNLHGWTLLDASERTGDLPDTILSPKPAEHRSWAAASICGGWRKRGRRHAASAQRVWR